MTLERTGTLAPVAARDARQGARDGRAPNAKTRLRKSLISTITADICRYFRTIQ